jgi:hypothetical protein
VTKSREIFLSLGDAERYIRGFEGKYGISSEDLLRDPTLREKVPEDDAFEWVAFLDLKKEIETAQEELHLEYLADLESAGPGIPHREIRAELLAA